MKRILLVALAELVLFFLCAAQEFHFVMLALQCIGNKENLWGYFLPFLVSSANAIYLFFTYHSFLNPRHKKGLKRLLIVNGAIMGALGLASASLVVIYVATGIYPSFCFGGVSTLFPLDGFILAIVEFLMGGFTIGFALLRADKLEWDEPKDEHGPAYRWIVQRILAGLQTFIAMLLLGDFLFGMYSVKELSGDVGLIIPTVILLILPPIELFLQRLIVDKLDPLKKHFYMMRVLP
ncbi:MAG: hypothetical protein HUJ60_02070, partial [Bacilli bacterium]|nr:hypothetical protein [Bacilli bacterium]